MSYFPVQRSEAEVAAKVDEILRRHPMPSSVERYTVSFGVDPVDEPAVHIYLHTNGEHRTQEEWASWIAEVNAFSRAVRREIIGAKLGVFPFVHLADIVREHRPA